MDFRLRQVMKEVMRKPSRQNKHFYSNGKTKPPDSPADPSALDDFVRQEQVIRMQRIKWERTKQRAFYFFLLVLLALFVIGLLLSR